MPFRRTCLPYDARAWQPFKGKANEKRPSRDVQPAKNQAAAAGPSGHAGKFRCLLEIRVQKQFVSIHLF
jgi:hypothetical protein